MVALAASFLAAGDSLAMNLENQPPVVIRTSPESGAKDVDPSISEIRVTFSKEMMDGNWSWVQIAPENFPEIIRGPRYIEDKKTCIIDVRLEPGRTYIIWLNTQKFQNFKDTDSRPAQPYLLMFETRK
jgi:RNA polymerase sigma-70 factor (ECF subfamily)